jgi:predicted ArsR family transcriptional regulator|tara:strand:- start:1262 stop:1495 length:234 start_codon:yes stop_codon:yes gene_type:complete
MTKRRGRPTVEVDWPEVAFTVSDVINAMNSKGQKPLTSAAIRLKIRQHVSDGSMEKVGKDKSKQGRPESCYRLTQQR